MHPTFALTTLLASTAAAGTVCVSSYAKHNVLAPSDFGTKAFALGSACTTATNTTSDFNALPDDFCTGLPRNIKLGGELATIVQRPDANPVDGMGGCGFRLKKGGRVYGGRRLGKGDHTCDGSCGVLESFEDVLGQVVFEDVPMCDEKGE